mmetsp:Transcript_9611/g.19641  ORF Transcript_9611/g.19641 Transcript_9611/m.19641 type:complete len:287 (-) Transcript_9611:570-1430(-)
MNAMVDIHFISAIDQFTVWSVDDVMRLRTQYRIVGDFAGTLPRFPAQNKVRGIPLLLTREEVALGVRKGFMRVIDDDSSAYRCEQAPPATTRSFAESFHKRPAELSAGRLGLQDTLDTPTTKRPRLYGMLSAAWNYARSIFQHGCDYVASQGGTSRIEGTDTTIEFATQALPRELKRRRKEVLPEVRPPLSDSRVAVFSDLWERGYFITSGIKFGVDFLAYAGDPSLFHAALMVVVKTDSDVVMMMEELVSLERLSKSTKKRACVAYCGGSGHVAYLGFQWHKRLR